MDEPVAKIILTMSNGEEWRVYEDNFGQLVINSPDAAINITPSVSNQIYLTQKNR